MRLFWPLVPRDKPDPKAMQHTPEEGGAIFNALVDRVKDHPIRGFTAMERGMLVAALAAFAFLEKTGLLPVFFAWKNGMIDLDKMRTGVIRRDVMERAMEEGDAVKLSPEPTDKNKLH